MSKRKHDAGVSSLYLDTVDRSVLDFDFEKVCSVSLSNLNVYACLVCGKYFQGRGSSSHAFFHSLDVDHHVFVNLSTKNVYVLPDGYQVADKSFDDIKYVIYPTFSKDDIERLDSFPAQTSMDLSGKTYVPGFVGLNNIKANDYINVIVQALAHIKPLRDFFLLTEISDKSSELAKRFGLLIRKLWSARAFKAQISPHEVVQQISSDSKKRFKITEQGDAHELLSWLLNSLHIGLGGSKKKDSSILFRLFQGQVKVESQVFEQEPEKDASGQKVFNSSTQVKTIVSPFLFLTLDLPPVPLFQDEFERNIIPQVSIDALLKKYDGATGTEIGNTLKRYTIMELPNYLIFHYKRFSGSNFKTEKNNTIVNFPLRGLDLKDCVPIGTKNTRYNLIANVLHQGGVKDGKYVVHVRDGAGKTWYMIEDLIVEQVLPQMIFLSEAYIQVIHCAFLMKDMGETIRVTGLCKYY